MARLNNEKRTSAKLEDVEEIEPTLIRNHLYYFLSTWQEVSPEGRNALLALAGGVPSDAVGMSKPIRLWLRRRQWIDEDGNLAVPVFGRWIREKDDIA